MDEPGLSSRCAAIRALAKDRRVSTDFIVRSTTPWELADGTPDKWRADFVNNLVDNDYALCVRGRGNFSFRLYEALSAGRVPVFVNTDCLLPCDDEVDWREVFVWVEESDLQSLPERILEFHERLSEAEFQERQRDCRQLWERYLSAHGFHRWLASRFVPAI
jgi:hypothetical protein